VVSFLRGDTAVGWEERIELNPDVLQGKPVVRGTRLAVELVVDLLAQGWTQERLVENYPNLKPEDIRACLAYASAALRDEKVYPLRA
jgi:uncharacterized protein (DUF433 family)